MPIDAYAPCPCGSGKKFKWCCQPIYQQLDLALGQDEQGQHESALRLLDEVIRQHPENPEPLGRKAELLYRHEQYDQAEQTLQRALALNPNYPFGHFLQGVLREAEGEIQGAVLLYRRAAELYDLVAKDLLAQIYSNIAACELKLNRPLAARAALQVAERCDPGNDGLRQAFAEAFGPQSPLPASARREWSLRRPPKEPDVASWERANSAAASGRLGIAAREFQALADARPEDATAWYNLAVTRAWLGENVAALRAFDRHVALETDETAAAAAWAVGEVLRCGAGAEAEADYLRHAAEYVIRDPRETIGFLDQWMKQHRLVQVRTFEEAGFVTGVILEQVPPLTAELAATHVVGIAAYLILAGEHLRLWHNRPASLAGVREEMEGRLGPALSRPQLSQGPAAFREILSEAIGAMPRATDPKEVAQRTLASTEHFFEETWIERPLHSLGLVSPAKAAKDPRLLKKLRGVIQFLEECAAMNAIPYSFDRLRRRLGQLSHDGAGAPGATAPTDFGGMGIAQLAAVAVEAMTDADVQAAFQAAVKLDAPELAARFAQQIVARPPGPGTPDRFRWYAHLVQSAVAAGRYDDAMAWVDQGERSDCEHNEGRHRNDFELRRGQIHAKRGEAGEAERVFLGLIDRAATELRFRGSAAEAMLSMRKGRVALGIAEAGLLEARRQKDRDSEAHFTELVEAARRRADG